MPPALKPCITCGALSRNSYCPTHRGNTSWNQTRDRGAQHTFRARVLEAAGYRCQWNPNGTRCPNTTELQAHHTEPGNNNPSTGLCLCRAHHRAIDKHAR